MTFLRVRFPALTKARKYKINPFLQNNPCLHSGPNVFVRVIIETRAWSVGVGGDALIWADGTYCCHSAHFIPWL